VHLLVEEAGHVAVPGCHTLRNLELGHDLVSMLESFFFLGQRWQPSGRTINTYP
jgi:hypothetical protein